jgi:hypothetical protein
MRPVSRRLLALVLIACFGLAFAPSAGAAEDPATQLAARYAPLVVIRDQPVACEDGEPYLPAAVESVLGRPGVTLRGPAGQAVSAPTAADLAGKGDGWFLDLPGNPLSPGCDYEEWFDADSAEEAPHHLADLKVPSA